MFLSTNNPVYNTIIVFTIIMLLLYITKPSVIYNDEINEFKQFGTTNGKTLLPIYVIGILLAILLYIFFNHFSVNEKKDKYIKIKKLDECDHYIQQQLQQLQNQIKYLMMNQQSMNQQLQ